MATADEVRAWMAETKRGYKAAAKRFGLTPAEVRDLVGQAAPPARARGRARESPGPASGMSAADYWAWRLERAHAEVEQGGPMAAQWERIAHGCRERLEGARVAARQEPSDSEESRALVEARRRLAELEADLIMCRETGKATALSQLHRLILEQGERVRLLEQADREERLAHLNDDDLVAMLADHVRALPAELQLRVRSAIEAVTSDAVAN